VHLAVERGLRLTAPVDVQEDPGAGIQGVVEGKRVAVGSLAFLRAQGLLDGAVPDDDMGVSRSGRFGIALDGRLTAILQVTDEAREEARRAIDLLRMLGIAKVVLATGDTAAIAGEIAASASSSPTCRARPNGSSPSTISAARRSNGSKSGKARSGGRGCRAGRSPPMPCGFSFMRWLTISPTSCGRSHCPRLSRTGR